MANMAPRPGKHTRQLAFFFLPTLLILSPTAAAVVSSSYYSHCSSPSPAPDRHADVSNDTEAELLRSFHLIQPSTGFFSCRGGDSLFSPDTNGNSGGSMVFLPRGVSRTADPTLLHLTATLMLFGGRVKTHEYDDGRPENHSSSTTISFNLDGYYSSTSSELCMVSQVVPVVSTGTEAADDILMTVRFASFGAPQGFGHGKGRVSSLRDSTDDLYFETRDIVFFGMGIGGNRQRQVSASIWRRMDPERIVTVASTMLSCVFTALFWRLRARRKRNHEEPHAMSMAVLVVIVSLGGVALEFILSHWVFFLVTFVHMFS